MKNNEMIRYIFLNSLFDERKCSHRFSYELKCSFKESGKQLERPDYFGTGEASGEFCQLDMETLKADVKNIC